MERSRGGTFKKGHKKLAGRQKGTPNKLTANLREAILEAIRLEGIDGHGTDGEVGFLRNAARKQLGSFLHSLLRPLVSLPPKTPEEKLIVYKNEGELRQALRDAGLHQSLLPSPSRDPDDERPPMDVGLIPSKAPEGWEVVLRKANRSAEACREQSHPEAQENDGSREAQQTEEPSSDLTPNDSSFPVRRRLKLKN